MKKKIITIALSFGIITAMLSGCGQKNMKIELDNKSKSEISVMPTEEPKDISEKTKSSDILDYLDEETAEFFRNGDHSAVETLTYGHFGEGGLTTKETDDAKLIERIYNAVKKIKIVEKTDMRADDYSEYFDFYLSDKKYSISFNMRNFEEDSECYIIENDEELWNCVTEMTDQYAYTDDESPELNDSEDTPVYQTYDYHGAFTCEIPYNINIEEDDEYGVIFYKDANLELEDGAPYIGISFFALGEIETADALMQSFKEEIQDTYQNRLAGEIQSYETVVDGRECIGLSYMFSGIEGDRRYSGKYVFDTVEDTVIIYYLLYLSDTIVDGEYEDENTLFEFEHMLETMHMNI